jgi:hypothetical protein
MKIIAVLFITLFVTFLSLPTAVALVKKSTNMDKFYSMSEEENSNNWNEIIHKITYTETTISVFRILESNVTVMIFLSDKLPSIERDIVIPPPKYKFV